MSNLHRCELLKKMTIYSKNGLVVRVVYLSVSLFFYIISVICRQKDKDSIVLCYHGIGNDQQQRFREQMCRLAEHSALPQISYRDGKKSLKTPTVVITFDDAFENLLDNAIPILEEFQIPSIVFAVSGNPGKVPGWNIAPGHPEANEVTVTAEQLITLSRNPLIRIGSHTLTHPDLSRLSADQIQWELAESKRDLEQWLSQPVEDLALPHGAFNDTVLQIAREVGYKRIYTLQPKLMSEGQLQEGVIGRFSMSPDVWPIEFYLTCSGAYAWLLPWRSFIRGVRRLLQRV